MSGQTQDLLATVGQFRLQRAARFEVDWKVRLAWPKRGIVNGKVTTVSTGGLFMVAAAQGAAGERLQMNLKLEHEGQARQMLIEGEITNSRPTEDPKKTGFGLRLTGIADADRVLFKEVLQRLSVDTTGEPIPPDMLRDVDDLRALAAVGARAAPTAAAAAPPADIAGAA
jgi:hypothetical protein